MHHPRLIEPGRTQRQVERGGNVAGLHCGAQLPGHDVAREVVEHGRQVVPAPAEYPSGVGRRGLMLPFYDGCRSG